MAVTVTGLAAVLNALGNVWIVPFRLQYSLTSQRWVGAALGLGAGISHAFAGQGPPGPRADSLTLLDQELESNGRKKLLEEKDKLEDSVKNDRSNDPKWHKFK